MAILNLDGAAILDIRGVYAHKSYDIVLTQFSDPEHVVPQPYTGTFKMIICRDEAMTNFVMTFTEADALNVSGNVLSIDRSVIENILAPRVYYYQLVNILDVDNQIVLAKGVLVINPSLIIEP